MSASAGVLSELLSHSSQAVQSVDSAQDTGGDGGQMGSRSLPTPPLPPRMFLLAQEQAQGRGTSLPTHHFHSCPTLIPASVQPGWSVTEAHFASRTVQTEGIPAAEGRGGGRGKDGAGRGGGLALSSEGKGGWE